jgi:hypothetical protein
VDDAIADALSASRVSGTMANHLEETGDDEAEEDHGVQGRYEYPSAGRIATCWSTSAAT